MAHLDTVKNDNKELRELKKTVLINIAIVCNKTGDFKEAVITSTKALDLDEKAVKALYQRALAQTKLHQYDEALTDIKEAIKLSPSEKNLRDEFEKIKELRRKANESQSKAARSLFS